MRKLKLALLLVVMMIASLCLSFACFGAIEIVDNTHEYTAISVTGAPTKTEYGVGETVSTAGLKVVVHCAKHDADEEISLSDVKFVYEHGQSFSYGDTKITLSYAGYTVEIPITVVCNNHVPKAAVQENVVPATCTEKGSYDEVVYCSVCNAEISRETKDIEKVAHTPMAAVQENVVPATCTANGSYDEVVYCSVCNTEISREQKVIEKTAHTPEEAVKQNEVPATCANEGSYDMVVYCSVCKEELSRVHEVIGKLPHTPMAAVQENVNPATCTANGSYEEVVYCSECNAELSREPKVIAALGHLDGETKYDEDAHWTECARCGEKLNATAHVFALEISGNYKTSYTMGETFDTANAIVKKACDCGYKAVVEYTVEYENGTAFEIGDEKVTIKAGNLVKEIAIKVSANIGAISGDFVVADITCGQNIVPVGELTANSGADVYYKVSADGINYVNLADFETNAPEDEDSITLYIIAVADATEDYTAAKTEPKTITLSHKASEELFYNAETHYYLCDCGKKFGEATHVLNIVKDEINHKHHYACDCGYETAPVNCASASEDWITDDNNHWKTCDVCGQIIEKESHDFDYESDGAQHWTVCSVCGVETPKYDCVAGDTEFDNDNHWKVCAVCGEIITATVEEHDLEILPDDDHDTHSYSCDCGYAIEEEACSTNSAEWIKDENYHWKTCSVCGQPIQLAAHVAGESEVDGIYSVVKCSVCGEELEKIIAEATTEIDLKWTAEGNTAWENGLVPLNFSAFGSVKVTELLYDAEEIGFDYDAVAFNFDDVKTFVGNYVFTVKVVTDSGITHDVIYNVNFITKGIYDYDDLLDIREISKAFATATGEEPDTEGVLQDGYFKLYSDITSNGEQWYGICEAQVDHFKGTIDGNGFAIDGLKMTYGNWRMSFIGGYFSGGLLKDIAFTNAVFKGNGSFLAMSGGRFTNVYIGFAELGGATNTVTHVLSRNTGYVATNVVIDLSALTATTLTNPESVVLIGRINNNGQNIHDVYVIDPHGFAKKNDINVFSMAARFEDDMSKEVTVYYTLNGNLRKIVSPTKENELKSNDYSIIGTLAEDGYAYNAQGDRHYKINEGDVWGLGDYSALIGIDTATWEEVLWTVVDNSVPYYADAVVIETAEPLAFANLTEGDAIAQDIDFTVEYNKANVKLEIEAEEDVLAKITLNGNVIRIEGASYGKEFKLIATYAFDYNDKVEINVITGKTTNAFDIGDYDLEINLNASIASSGIKNNNAEDYEFNFFATDIADYIDFGEIDEVTAVYFNDVLVDAAPSLDLDAYKVTFNAKNIPATVYGKTAVTVMFSGEYSLFSATLYINVVTKAISTENELKNLWAFVSEFADNGGYYVLDSDIELTGIFSDYSVSTFNGVLDGRGHTVDGLWVIGTVASGQTCPGCFINTLAKDGVIKNIGFTNVRTATKANFIYNVYGTLDNVYIQMKYFVSNSGGNWSNQVWSGTYILGSQYGGGAIWKNVVIDMTATADYIAGLTTVPAIGHDYYSFFVVNGSDTASGIMVLGVPENWKDNVIRVTNAADNNGGNGASINAYVEYVDGTNNGVDISFEGFNENYWYLIDGFTPMFASAFDMSDIEFVNVSNGMDLPIGTELAIETSRKDVILSVEGEGVSIENGVLTIANNISLIGNTFTVTATNIVLPEITTTITINIIATVVEETLSEVVEVNFEAAINGSELETSLVNINIDLSEFAAELGETAKVVIGTETVAEDVEISSNAITLDASIFDVSKDYGEKSIVVATYKDNTNYYITVNMFFVTKTIETAQEFVALKNYIALMENNGGYFILGANVELEDENVKPTSGLNIYGNNSAEDNLKYDNRIANFSGTIDGRGYSVKNMVIAGYKASGWIKNSDGATIKNIGISNIVKCNSNAIVYEGEAHFENCYFQFDSLITCVMASSNAVTVGYVSDLASVSNPSKAENSTYDNVVVDFTVAVEQWKNTVVTSGNYKGMLAIEAAETNYAELMTAIENERTTGTGKGTDYYHYYADDEKTVEITRDGTVAFWYAFNANYQNYGGALVGRSTSSGVYDNVIVVGVPAPRVDCGTIFRVGDSYSNGASFDGYVFVKAIDGTTNGLELDVSSFSEEDWFLIDGYTPIFKSAFDSTPVAVTNLSDGQEVYVDSVIELALNRADVVVTISELEGVSLEGNVITVSANAQVGASFTITVTNVIDPLNTATIEIFLGYKVEYLESENVAEFNFEAEISGEKLVSANSDSFDIDVSDLADYLGTTAEVKIGEEVIKADAEIVNGVITLNVSDVDPAKAYGETSFTVKTLKGNTNYIISAPAKIITKTISTTEEFTGIKNYVALIDDNGGYFVLGDDIALVFPEKNDPNPDNYADKNIWGAGYVNNPDPFILYDNRIDTFSGVIDGNGFSVDGMALAAHSASAWIINSNDATIKNISFTNVHLAVANTFVMNGAVTLENVYIDVATVNVIKRYESKVVKEYVAASYASNSLGIFRNSSAALDHTLKNVVIDYTKATQDFIDRGYGEFAEDYAIKYATAVENGWVTGSGDQTTYYVSANITDPNNAINNTTATSYTNYWTAFLFNQKAYGGTMIGWLANNNLIKDVVILGIPERRLSSATGKSTVFRTAANGYNDGSAFGAYVEAITGLANGQEIVAENWDSSVWKFVNGKPVPTSFAVAEEGHVEDAVMELDVYMNGDTLAKRNSGSVNVYVDELVSGKTIVAVRDAFRASKATYNFEVVNNEVKIPYAEINASTFGDTTFYVVTDDGCFYSFTLTVITKYINNAEEFIALKDYIANIEGNGGYFILAEDITLENTNNIYCGGYNEDQQVCDNRILSTFTGIIDGQGHIVDNLRLSNGRSSVTTAWLTSVNGATLKNVSFTNFYRAAGQSLIGDQGGSITVENVYIQVASMARMDYPNGAYQYIATTASNLGVLRNGGYTNIQDNDAGSKYTNIVMDFSAATVECETQPHTYGSTPLNESPYYKNDTKAGAVAGFFADLKNIENFVVTGIPAARLTNGTVFRVLVGGGYVDGSQKSSLFVADINGNTNGNDFDEVVEAFDGSYWKVVNGKLLPKNIGVVIEDSIEDVVMNLEANIVNDEIVTKSTGSASIVLSNANEKNFIAIRDAVMESAAEIEIPVENNELVIPYSAVSVAMSGEKTMYLVTDDNCFYKFTLKVITKAISTTEEFTAIKDYVALIENNGGYFVLANDIELVVPANNLVAADYADKNIWGAGYSSAEVLFDNRIANFSGTIDGNGYVVNNLFVGALTQSGWIMNAADATIKNIAFTNLTLSFGNTLVNGGTATFENVYAEIASVTLVKRCQNEKVTSYTSAGNASVGSGITRNASTGEAHTLTNVVVDYTKATAEFISLGFAATAEENYQLYLTAIENGWYTGTGKSGDYYKFYTDGTLETQITFKDAVNYWTGFQVNFKSYGGTMMGFLANNALITNVVVLGVPSERLDNAHISSVTGSVFRTNNNGSNNGVVLGAYVADYAGNTNGVAIDSGKWSSDFWSFGSGDVPTFVACLNKEATYLNEINLDAYIENEALASSEIAYIDLTELDAVLLGETADVYVGDELVAKDAAISGGKVSIDTANFPVANVYGEVTLRIVTTANGKVNTLTAPALVITKGIGDYDTLDNLYEVVTAMGNNGYYVITADIANSEEKAWEHPLAYDTFDKDPSDDMAFEGTIDGNGYTIDGLIFNNTYAGKQGNNYSLLGATFGGVVKNVRFTNVNFVSGKAAVIANYGMNATGKGGLIENVYVSFATINASGDANLQGTFIRTGRRVVFRDCVVNLEDAAFNGKHGFNAIGCVYDINYLPTGFHGIDGVFVYGIKDNMGLVGCWYNNATEHLTYVDGNWTNFKVVSNVWTEETELGDGQSKKVAPNGYLGAYVSFAAFKAAYGANAQFTLDNNLISVTSKVGTKTEIDSWDAIFWAGLIEELNASDGDPGTGINATLIETITDAQMIGLAADEVTLDLTAAADYVGAQANVVYNGEILANAHLITVVDSTVTINVSELVGATAGNDTIYIVSIVSGNAYRVAVPVIFVDAVISNKAELDAIGDVISDNEFAYIVIAADIEYDGEWAGNENDFKGTIDGNGHTISGITFTETSGSFIGGTLSGTIKNLTLENVTVGIVSIIADAGDAARLENVTISYSDEGINDYDYSGFEGGLFHSSMDACVLNNVTLDLGTFCIDNDNYLTSYFGVITPADDEFNSIFTNVTIIERAGQLTSEGGNVYTAFYFEDLDGNECGDFDWVTLSGESIWNSGCIYAYNENIEVVNG